MLFFIKEKTKFPKCLVSDIMQQHLGILSLNQEFVQFLHN